MMAFASCTSGACAMIGCSTEDVRIPCLVLRTDSNHDVIDLLRASAEHAVSSIPCTIQYHIRSAVYQVPA